MAQLVKNPPAMQETWLRSLGWDEPPWRRVRVPTPVFLGFPGGLAGKESACSAGDLGWEDLLEKGKSTHCSVLAWRIPWIVYIVHGVAKSQTQLSDFHFHVYIHVGSDGKESRSPVQETQVRSLGGEDPLEEELSTHSSILAWRIPWTEEPGGLQSMGSQRVGQN